MTGAVIVALLSLAGTLAPAAADTTQKPRTTPAVVAVGHGPVTSLPRAAAVLLSSATPEDEKKL